MLSDVTELKKIDRLKSEFVSTVSHELRTPLTSIRGSLGLLAGGVGGPIPGEARELLEIAQKNCDRLILLINDILDIDKIESGSINLELVNVNLTTLVEAAVSENAAFALEHQVTLKIVESLSEAQVRLDPGRFAQLMANLLSNAAKYSPRNSRVEISVCRIPIGFRINIRDHGPGIAAEFAARMFMRFSQSDSSDTRRAGGTGLGLAISKSLAERFGGLIGYEPTPSGGSTFYVDLPKSVAEGQIAETPRVVHRTDVRMVLICEDDADVATTIAGILSSDGIASIIAASAAAAKAELAVGHFDAMTLDLTLPDQDGLALLGELRQSEATRTLPVVVVTADIAGANKFSGGTLEVADWMVKPLDPARLVAAIPSRRSGNPKTVILHVADDVDLLRIVESVLAEKAEVRQAPTLDAARAHLAGQQFDLVILDLALGYGHGTVLLPEIESLSPPPPVLLFSAHEPSAESSSRVAAALQKNRADNAELLSTLKRLIG